MKTIFGFIVLILAEVSTAQNKKLNVGIPAKVSDDTVIHYIYDAGDISTADSITTVTFREVNIVSFKTAEEWMLYYKYKSRIQKVMPYVKIANQLYAELKEEKENEKKRVYRHYRKDVEKERRFCSGIKFVMAFFVRKTLALPICCLWSVGT